MDEAEILVLESEDGEEEAYKILTQFRIEEWAQDYIALMPMDALDDAEEDEEVDVDVYFFRYSETDGEPDLTELESAEEIALVGEIFRQLLEEEEEEEAS